MLLFTIRYIMSEWSDGIYIHDYNYEKIQSQLWQK